MEEENLQKGCSIQKHTETDTIFICMKEDCDQTSRAICLECIQERLHDHNQYFIKAKDLLNSEKPMVNNWPSCKYIRELYNYSDGLEGNGKQLQEKIDKTIDYLQTELSEAFMQQKNEVKQQITESLETNTKKCSEAKKQIEKSFTVQPLRKLLQDFQTGKINQKKLNTELKKFATKGVDEESRKIMDKYGNDIQVTSTLKNFTNQLITNCTLIAEEVFNNVIQTRGIYQRLTFELMQNCQGKIEKSRNIYETFQNNNYYGTFMSNETIKGNSNFKFSFQLLVSNNNYFYMGFVNKHSTNSQQYFWFPDPTSVQWELKSGSNQSTWKQIGSKTFAEAYQQNQVYEVEVKSGKIIITIRDQSLKYESSSLLNLDSEYVFIFSNHADGILKVQFL